MSEHKHLYHKAAWRKKSKLQREIEPLCRFCLAQGIVRQADVADHCVPHRGDENLFWNGELQSLCGPCHSAAKQRIETFGFHSITDLDGYPLDPNHPSNVDARKRG